ncbi:MAG: replicative DNA helicase, partial [Pseudonocardia sp. SCN 72-51]
YYAEIVSEKAILRRLVEAGTRIVQLGYHGADGSDVDEVVDRAQAAIYEVTERTTSEDYTPLEELLQPTMDEIDAIASRGGVALGVPTGFTDLDALTNGLHPGQMVVVAARPGLGKALALDTPLPTPSGWTTMGEVAVGDLLIDADGLPTRVVAATEVMAGRPCFEVEFSDGTVIVADAQHQWLTETRTARRRLHSTGIEGVPTAELQEVVTTAQIAATVHDVDAGDRPNHSVTLCEPLQLPERHLPVAPYTLGVWLGAAMSGATGFIVDDPAIAENVGRDGYTLVPMPKGRFGLQLPDTGLGLAARQIPGEYLRASESQRRALLAGLMDTAGTVTGAGAARLRTTSGPLAETVRELALTVGYRCTTSAGPVRGSLRESSTEFVVDVDTADEVFGTTAKRMWHNQRRDRRQEGPQRRYVVDVRPVESVPVRCVEVDNAAHLYLAGRSMVPTHNSTLGLDFARSCSVKHGMTSAVFSLEMSKSEIVMRLLSAEAQIRLADMRAGRMSDEDWTRMARRMSEISEAPLFVDDSPNLTLMEIRAKARRLKQRNDLKLIILDYLQLMTSGRKVESRQQEVSEFSRQIKLLAKELEVPVVAMSQLNRGPEQRNDKRPMLSDLRESGSIEQDADMVILLHRPDAFERDDPRAGEADLILAKHRNGPQGTITVAHQLHYSRFADLAHG